MRYPYILLCEWVEKNVVRVFLHNGRIADIALPVKSAKRAKIIYHGVALDADGKGYEIAADTLADMLAVREYKPGVQPRRYADDYKAIERIERG